MAFIKADFSNYTIANFEKQIPRIVYSMARFIKRFGTCFITRNTPVVKKSMFLFMTSETRDGARRRKWSKLSYSAPYNQAENSEESLSLPLAATSHPYKPPKYTLDTDSVPETRKQGL